MTFRLSDQNFEIVPPHFEKNRILFPSGCEKKRYCENFQAAIVLLHVTEKMPQYLEGRLSGLLGKEQWKQMKEFHRRNARETLIGKKSSNKLIKEALAQFCNQSGIDDASCGYHSREIVITDGDVVNDIIENAKEYNCNLEDFGWHGSREGDLKMRCIKCKVIFERALSVAFCIHLLLLVVRAQPCTVHFP